MADEKYLLQRGHAWFFHMAIPKDLHGKFGLTKNGKPIKKIVETLHTRDPIVAQRKRWHLADKWNTAFERVRSNTPLTRGEIEAQALEVYTSTLERMETQARLGRPWAWAEPQGEGENPEIVGLELALSEIYYPALEAPDFKLHGMVRPSSLEPGAEWVDRPPFSPIADELAAVQRRTGVIVPEGTETYQLLAEALLRAVIAAINGRMAALEGRPSETPATFLTPLIDRVTLRPVASLRPSPAASSRPKVHTGGAGPRVSEAGERYIAERQRDPDASLTAQTAAQVSATFRLFADFSGDARLDTVKRSQAADFLTALGRLHRHYAHRAKPKTPLATLLQEHAAGPGEGLSNRTLNRHQSALATLWKWARKAGLLDDAALNPFADLSRPKAKRREWLPFETSELVKLFNGLTFEPRPERHSLASALPWVMAIGLYSGMRESEICDMDGAQVKRERGVWFFDIPEAKSEAGVRRVPVHSALIGLGLLDYIKAMGQGPLFPGIAPGGPDKKRSHTFTKRFTTYRRTCGVTRARLVFHSFRKCFVRALEAAGIDRDRAAQVIGHERGFTFRVYNPEGVDMKELQKVIEAVRYDGVKLPRP